MLNPIRAEATAFGGSGGFGEIRRAVAEVCFSCRAQAATGAGAWRRTGKQYTRNENVGSYLLAVEGTTLRNHLCQPHHSN